MRGSPLGQLHQVLGPMQFAQAWSEPAVFDIGAEAEESANVEQVDDDDERKADVLFVGKKIYKKLQ